MTLTTGEIYKGYNVILQRSIPSINGLTQEFWLYSGSSSFGNDRKEECPEDISWYHDSDAPMWQSWEKVKCDPRMHQARYFLEQSGSINAVEQVLMAPH